jgi:hypothetical protein
VPEPAIRVAELLVARFDTNEKHATAHVEQVSRLIPALPENVQAKALVFFETAEAEAVKAVETLLISMAQAADRLHELTTHEEGDGQEAEAIEQLLVEWCEELFVRLEVEYDEPTIAAFIARVKAEAYSIPFPAETVRLDAGTHERKFGWNLIDDIAQATDSLALRMGRLTVQLSLAPTT